MKASRNRDARAVAQEVINRGQDDMASLMMSFVDTSKETLELFERHPTLRVKGLTKRIERNLERVVNFGE